MSVLERVLEPGSTELLDCRCGKEMNVVRTKTSADRPEACIRIYECPACHHELQLTVWAD